MVLHSGRLQPYLQTLDKAGKAVFQVKAKTLPKSVVLHSGRLQPYLQTLDKAVKAEFQGKARSQPKSRTTEWHFIEAGYSLTCKH